MTTVELVGTFWRVDADAFVTEYEAKPPIARPRYALACCSCAQICTIGSPCRCCKDIGTKAGGSGRIVRGIQHEHNQLPIDDVLEQLRRAA